MEETEEPVKRGVGQRGKAKPKYVKEPEDYGIEYHLTQASKEAPKVAGHSMTSREYDAFYLFSTIGKNHIVEERLGLPSGTITRYKQSAWWKELHEKYVSEKQRDFHQNMARRNEEIEKAYFEILNGEDKNDRTAQARMQGVRMYMEAGSDPIIAKKGGNLAIVNSQIGSGNVKIDQEAIKHMTQDEILEMALTGEVPDKAIKEVN